jgi:hypothetical protein
LHGVGLLSQGACRLIKDAHHVLSMQGQSVQDLADKSGRPGCVEAVKKLQTKVRRPLVKSLLDNTVVAPRIRSGSRHQLPGSFL